MVNKVKERKSDIKFNITLSDEQKVAKQEVLVHPFNFIIGNAGTGKTIFATYLAISELFNKNFDRIIITRPTVGTEDNGFLPGTLEEKMEPWLIPIKSNLRKVYNHPEKIQSLENESKIQIMALQHFRGNTFDNAICIVDEFQNLNKSQLRMAIGRLGKNSIMIFCGDYQQIDLKNKNDSAIHDVKLLENSKHAYIVEFIENHRHPALNEILELLK